VDDELLRAVDISKRVGVTRAAVSNWQDRYPDYPEPAEVTQHVELWRWEDIAAFLHRHKLPSKLGGPRSPLAYELLRNGRPVGEYPTAARARVELILALAQLGETGLRLAEAVVSNRSVDEVELDGTVFHIRRVNRRRNRVSATSDTSPAE
jgi:hypothetical protein